MAQTTFPIQTEQMESLSLTRRAADEIRSIKAANNVPDAYGLRVGVKGGGCSGLSYVLAFEAEPREGDKILVIEGIRVFIDPKSLMYLSGTSLDYQDGLMGKGFVFSNPQASKTCGCGNSFTV